MSNYYIVIVSILNYYSKSISPELTHSLSSLSPSDDKLKPSISTIGRSTLFGRAGDLFLTGNNVHLQTSNHVQWLMGYIIRGVTECMKGNQLVHNNDERCHHQNTVDSLTCFSYFFI